MKAKLIALVALLFVSCAELLRAVGSLLDGVAGQIGTLPAAGVAIGLFVLAGVLLATLRRASLPGVVLLLLLVRLTAQFAPNVAIVGAGAVLALVALALAVQRAVDPVTAVTGVLAGGVVDLALRALTSTWDPIWIGGWGLPMVVVPAVAIWLALAVRAPDGQTGLGRSWCVGGYLALWTATIGNPAFVASQSGVPLQLSIVVMMAASLIGLELVRRAAMLPLAGVVAMIGVTGGLVLAWWGGGPAGLAGVFVAQLSVAVAFARAVAVPSLRGSTLVGLAWVLPVLLFQLHYDVPLPFDNRILPVAIGVLVGLAGAGRRQHPAAAMSAEAPPPGIFQVNRPSLSGLVQPVTVALALALLVPVGVLTIKRAQAETPAVTNTLRLLSWNVRYARDDGSSGINPRQIAEVIRSAAPDVVVLQEVSRGWAIGGGLDLAEWLAQDLGMASYWAPAADRQFGNLLLVRRGWEFSAESGRLPFGAGPMWRSYLKVRVGELVILATHLAHKKENTPTRLAQIERVLEEKPHVIAGDMNFWPTWDEAREFTGAGYVSAQDFLGQGGLFTSPTDRPTNRVDWVFGNEAVTFLGFRIMAEAKASDHFPILTVLTSPALARSLGI